MVRLIKVQAQSGYRLHLEFSDGVAGDLDLTDRLWGPMFEPLRDEAFFFRVSIDEYGVPCWPNGADLAPDALHQALQNDRGPGARP